MNPAFRARDLGIIIVLVVCVAQAEARAEGGVTYRDIAVNGGAGLVYHRGFSATKASYDDLRLHVPFTFQDIALMPEKSRGAPGVAIFDFDGDGDLDIYVTNGPGRANSLFSSQLRQTGRLTFVDVAAQAGVAAIDQDSTGVCYGDIDNDGDEDLLILGRSEPNRLFENRGGSFVDITASSGVGGGDLGHTSCSMGDVNGDGLLDVVVANTHDWSNRLSIFVVPYDLNQPNQLFINRGGRQFTDESATSGLLDLGGLPPGAQSITWAIALVDVDLDGDLDVVHADDNGAIPFARYGGVDRGFIQILKNNGAGHFTPATVQAHTDHPGSWMGLAFGDLNCDGVLDIFGTNLGDYMPNALPTPHALGDQASRWLLGRADGTFSDLGVGDLVATPFGWGVSMVDDDNDGDLDVIFHGGLDVGPFEEASNPGAILRNVGCSASFVADTVALAQTDGRKNVQGQAAGDLDGDGFVDIVWVSGYDFPPPLPLVPFPDANFGSPYDSTAFLVPTFTPTGPGEFVWNGFDFPEGTLSVAINSGNHNGSVSLDLVGSVGLTAGGRNNRDGIGAVVTLKPRKGKPVMLPLVGGASYASQDSHTLLFGLDKDRNGTIEVLWPGGVRNRLYDVHVGEHVRFPEIPCSFAASWPSESAYNKCVKGALDDLAGHGVIDQEERDRLLDSAQRARED